MISFYTHFRFSLKFVWSVAPFSHWERQHYHFIWCNSKQTSYWFQNILDDLFFSVWWNDTNTSSRLYCVQRHECSCHLEVSSGSLSECQIAWLLVHAKVSFSRSVISNRLAYLTSSAVWEVMSGLATQIFRNKITRKKLMINFRPLSVKGKHTNIVTLLRPKKALFVCLQQDRQWSCLAHHLFQSWILVPVH
jgi:hypothetical protein